MIEVSVKISGWLGLAVVILATLMRMAISATQ